MTALDLDFAFAYFSVHLHTFDPPFCHAIAFNSSYVNTESPYRRPRPTTGQVGVTKKGAQAVQTCRDTQDGISIKTMRRLQHSFG